MNYNFEVIETQPQPVLLIKKTTSVANLPQELQKGYGTIINYIKEKGEHPIGPAFTAYYNMDMEHLEFEMGFPVAKEMLDQGEIAASYIPGGKKATTIFKGPYKEMEAVYGALIKWMNDNGYIPTGVVYEYYYNSPMEVPESELLTKIEFLIK